MKRVADADTDPWSYAGAAAGIANTTTAVTIKAAVAGKRNYVTDLQLSHATLGAATEIAIRDGAGGSVLWRADARHRGQREHLRAAGDAGVRQRQHAARGRDADGGDRRRLRERARVQRLVSAELRQDHLAREARRLLEDEVLRHAFDAVRQDAIEALASVDADDRTGILRLQARAAVVDEVRAGLQAMIMRAGVREQNEASFA